MKKCFKRVSAFFNRYINGTKGAISLFLAFLLTPILSLSLILVESARYQSVVQLMEELQDLCGLSTLSNYDSYVEDRFGLFSVDQEKDPSELFGTYMEENHKSLGNAVTLLDSTEVSGKFPLSEEMILRQQIEESSMIGVVGKTINDFGKIGELLSNLLTSKVQPLKNLSKTIKQLLALGDLTKCIVGLTKAVKEAITAGSDLTDAISAYQNAYREKKGEEYVGFGPDAKALVDALKTAENNLTEDSEADDVWEDEAVEDAVKDLDDANSNYIKKAKALKNKLSTYSSKMAALNEELTSLGEAIISNRKEFNTTDTDKTFDVTGQDWMIGVLTRVHSTLLGTIPAQITDYANADQSRLQSQINTLTSLSQGDYQSFDSNWTDTDIQEKYGSIKIWTPVSKDLLRALKNASDELAQEVDVSEEGSLLSDLLELLNMLFDIKLFYDGSLNAVVGVDYLYNKNMDYAVSDAALIGSIRSLVSAGQNFKDTLQKDGFLLKLVSLAKALTDIIAAVIQFLGSVVAVIREFIVGLVRITGGAITDMGGEVNDLLLFGYGAYNLPNRTNYKSGKSLTGYSYKNVFLANGGLMSDSNSLGGSIFDEVMTAYGSDPAFKGAIQEYLMVGSNSEYINQFNVFMKMYIFRLCLDMSAVLSNKEWTATGGLSIVIKVLIALIEPFLDMIFLVNGQSEAVLKDKLYLTPSGLPELLKKVSAITQGSALSTLTKNKIDEKTEDKNKKDDSVDWDYDYSAHLYFLTVILCDPKEYVQRLQNVIQTETAQYYRRNSNYTFEIDKAYTYVYSTLHYRLNPMISIDMLTDGGVFDVISNRYSGY